jgi:SAM-dependent methyltransferase
MEHSLQDKNQIQSAIGATGPGEHGERVVLYEQAFHDEQASYYDKLFADPLPLLVYYQRLISRQIYSYVRQQPFVVDLCCGTGKSSLPLVERGIFVVAVDVSREMLRIYKRKCDEKGYRNVLFIHADASRPPLQPDSCGAITMIGGLHHIQDREGSIHHCHRALAKNGLLILHEPVQTGHTSPVARFLENLYAATDPGRAWRAVKRRLGSGAARPGAVPAEPALADFTPYERPFHSSEELLALMPPQTEVAAIRSQGVLSFHEFAPPLQKIRALALPLAAAVVQLDDWLSGDARKQQSGDALFAVCRKTG